MNHGSYTICIANAAFVNPPNTASEPEKVILFARGNLNMLPGRLWKTAGPAGSAAAAAAVGSFRGVKPHILARAELCMFHATWAGTYQPVPARFG